MPPRYAKRGIVIKSHLRCAQNNRREAANASALSKTALTNPWALRTKRLQRFAF
jgi:hypothetical protein